jgi:pimeloyl-ACP methyl ester carboxylesterase
MTASAPSRATSSDGTSIAYYESGPRDAPTIVAVHGYPDNHTVWDAVVPLLADDYRVVTYDVRGTGASDKPAERDAYRRDRLVDDLHAVLDAVGGQRVHLVGHDWGSVQCWPALLDDRVRARVATFTSMSGPSIDYASAWLRNLRDQPRVKLRQALHSYYILFFQLPRLPEFAIRRGFFERVLEPGAERTTSDAINGLELYRANMLRGVRRPQPLPDDLPVQLIVLDHDKFVTPAMAIDSARPWVRDLAVEHVAGGHWVMTRRPEAVVEPLRTFLATH